MNLLQIYSHFLPDGGYIRSILNFQNLTSDSELARKRRYAKFQENLLKKSSAVKELRRTRGRDATTSPSASLASARV